jgi:hypothetical protein
VLHEKAGMDEIASTEAPSEEDVGAPAANAFVRRVRDDAAGGLAVDEEPNVGLPHRMSEVVVEGAIDGGNILEHLCWDINDMLHY